MKSEFHLSVPADLQYLVFLEEYVEMLARHLPQKECIHSGELRTAINEAFVNVIKHAVKSGKELIEVRCRVDGELLVVEVRDPGRGLMLEEELPPYPASFINREFSLCDTVDGNLVARVISPTRVELSFVDRSDLLPVENIREGGMGLSIITKYMDEVFFEWAKERGNTLRFQKRFKRNSLL